MSHDVYQFDLNKMNSFTKEEKRTNECKIKKLYPIKFVSSEDSKFNSHSFNS